MITMDKQYKTRDGREVRILCVDSDVTEYPVVAQVRSHGGGFYIYQFSKDGSFFGSVKQSKMDLIEVKPKITMDKQYKTRSGIPVRILCIDSGFRNYPVVALTLDNESPYAERVFTYTATGEYYPSGLEHTLDIFETKGDN